MKGGLGVSGALAGFGTFLTTEMGAGLALSALSSPPVAVTLATVGTVAVGTGAAGLSGKIVEKVFNSRAKSRKWWQHFNPWISSSKFCTWWFGYHFRSEENEEYDSDQPPSPSEFDSFWKFKTLCTYHILQFNNRYACSFQFLRIYISRMVWNLGWSLGKWLLCFWMLPDSSPLFASRRARSGLLDTFPWQKWKFKRNLFKFNLNPNYYAGKFVDAFLK